MKIKIRGVRSIRLFWNRSEFVNNIFSSINTGIGSFIYLKLYEQVKRSVFDPVGVGIDDFLWRDILMEEDALNEED